MVGLAPRRLVGGRRRPGVVARFFVRCFIVRGGVIAETWILHIHNRGKGSI